MSTNDIFSEYLRNIAQKYAHTETSEMGYRTDLENLLRTIFSEINVKRIGHDERSYKGNKPDYIIWKNDIPILYIEAKDMEVSLDKIEKSEQMARYYGYQNLVLTDYVEFRFYRNGERYQDPIVLATYDKKSRTINTKPESFELLNRTLIDFTQSSKEPIKSGRHLAKIMGGKALRIRENVREIFTKEHKTELSIYKVYETMQKTLIRDMDEESFADMYAQTLVYGLFVARFHDKSESDFSRREARDLVPKSNPLLRHFFDHIAGEDFDQRLEYIVDELCEVLKHADIGKLMSNYYGEEKTSRDPVIHFYEDFLQEYDPIKRKEFGAYYTPLPVVSYIVRSVDKILQKDFGLPEGLASSSKIDGQHRVQILDPATGTGTFLTEIIKQIYSKFENQKGRWTTYVHHDLLPRLFGFEIMMAPYTIAHLKMSMFLKNTGFTEFYNTRLGIYLTNSLEEGNTMLELMGDFGLAGSINNESREATRIKHEKPVMVIVGNPPYKAESQNKGAWIQALIEDFKKEPGGVQKLQEKNYKWLNDDYVKFLRFGQHFVEKNGSGIVAFINPHGFLDNPTFRGMRWKLLKTYDKLFVLNLHGNTNKKEKSPDGHSDENVFDIKQGVSINIFVKTGEKRADVLGQVYYKDLWGTREQKFGFLDAHSSDNIEYTKLNPSENMYNMISMPDGLEKQYKLGFELTELFPINGSGIVTKRDNLCIQFSSEKALLAARDILDLPKADFYEKYSLPPDVRDWRYEWAKADVMSHGISENQVLPITYRPFDTRYIYYSGRSRGFVGWPVVRIMRNLLGRDAIGLVAPKQAKDSAGVFVVQNIAAHKAYSAYDINYVFPLYTVSESGELIPNLSREIVEKLTYGNGAVTPLRIFDYVYAILNSRSYWAKYKPFLAQDFPRVPYPENEKKFNKLSELGLELRELHLLKATSITPFEISYMGDGENEVEALKFDSQKVFINQSQYFGNVPESAWNFHIGGYQPAQKWLKDRKGRKLTNEEIEHYQKIIIVLRETEKIMREIDKVAKELI